MTPPPDFSILIVTRNTARLTSEAVTSVLTCGDRATVEVVVIDNGSTDGTGEQLKARFPQVRYVYSAENQGFARANNLAASQASGSVLLLLNSALIVVALVITLLAMLAAARNGVDCFSYTPQAIKNAVCGSGDAAKRQVQRMVATLLGLSEPPRPDHAADALAVAICHGGSAGLREAAAAAGSAPARAVP